MMKVYLTDDQTLFLDSLRLYLEGDPEVDIVGSSATGGETLKTLPVTGADILLLDLKLPDMPGIEVAAAVKRNCPGVKIIILTSFEDEEDMLAVLAEGIDAYLVKDIAPRDLISVMKTVAADFSVMYPGSREFIRRIIRKEMGHYRALAGEYNLGSLNVQEYKIVKLVTEGQSNKEIAASLGYTEGTIKNYLSRILQKTGCRDRTHLAVQALREDLED